jgi:putative heme-binding domain-containing protein
LLQDKDARVRRAAAAAAGKLRATLTSDALLKLTADTDTEVRRAALNSLRLLREPRVIPRAVAALTDRALDLAALECLTDLGGPQQAQPVLELAKHNPSIEVLQASVRALSKWHSDRAVAEVHGATGVLVRWQADTNSSSTWDPPGILAEPYSIVGATPLYEERTLIAAGLEGRIRLATKSEPKAYWLAYADVFMPETAAVEFLASSNGALRICVNGKCQYQRKEAHAFQVDSDRIAVTLGKGMNRVLVHVGGAKEGAAEFHLRFRRKSVKADLERLAQAALARAGNIERGRKLFFDKEKSLCLKCHQLGNEGERIGPELTGVGSRFARIYLVESILEPSRTIAPSFGTLAISLKTGKVLTGVRIAETDTTLTLADNQGQKTTVAKADIEEQQTSPISTMPEGLEKRFSEDEFVDLIAFLASQKQDRK